MIPDHNIAPINRPREAAGPAYDRMSNWYDLMTGLSEKRYRKAGLKMLNAKPGENILEIGCGTGHSAVTIARSVEKNGHYLGMDISAKMLEKTRKQLERADMKNRSRCLQADACLFSFDKGSFDAVFMSFTLELFSYDDMLALLKNLHACLKPDGRLVIVNMSKKEHPGLMVKMYEYMHKKFPSMVDCRPVPIKHLLDESAFQITKRMSMSLAGIPVEISESKPLK
jgi:ubiquinone/menaquinone biosynthesis C-methylase UbiE